MMDKDKKFSVGEGNDIEENIKKLQRELDEMFLKGAPEIKKEDVEGEVRRMKLEEEGTDEKREDSPPPVPQRRYVPDYYKDKKSSGDSFGLFKNTKFYIVIFGIIAFAFTLIKAPVFRYTTPPRHDNDIPEIDVGFRYYNNIFGKQTKSETIVYIGKEIIVMPISMERWFNMEKEKKLTAINYYRNL
ncbi:MAG TPA: hypothetical protein PLQ41_02800 [bacterium]|nr:hypothetical protein [bacterium]HPP30119.1 hypothetical protein [bacterium]